MIWLGLITLMFDNIVLSTPRSGSTYFCDVLSKITHLGNFNEWLLNFHDVNNGGKSFDEILNDVRTSSLNYDRTSSGIKVQITFLDGLQLINGIDNADLYDFSHQYFNSSNCIFLFRRNLIKQSISYIYAEKTSKFHSIDNVNLPEKVLISNLDILNFAVNLYFQNLLLVNVFCMLDGRADVVCYEHFVRDRNLDLHFSGISAPVNISSEYQVFLRDEKDRIYNDFISKSKFSKSLIDGLQNFDFIQESSDLSFGKSDFYYLIDLLGIGDFKAKMVCPLP